MRSISRKSDISRSVVVDDIKWILRYAKSSIIITTLVVAVLLFFLNILIWTANQANIFGSQLQDKLWLYLEINKQRKDSDEVYGKVLKLQKTLDNIGIKNKFISEKEWLKQMTKSMPDIINTLNQYNISSPFNDMLYIYIKSEDQYNQLKDIIKGYSDIIQNSENISYSKEFLDQENRIVKAIKFTNFIISWTYFLVWVFLIIIIANIFYLVRILIAKFREQIELKKLLWASYNQISNPFFAMIAWIIWIWSIVMILLILLLDIYLSKYNFSLVFFVDIFSLDIIPESFGSVFNKARYIIPLEVILLIWVSVFINGNYLYKVIKKAWN